MLRGLKTIFKKRIEALTVDTARLMFFMGLGGWLVIGGCVTPQQGLFSTALSRNQNIISAQSLSKLIYECISLCFPFRLISTTSVFLYLCLPTGCDFIIAVLYRHLHLCLSLVVSHVNPTLSVFPSGCSCFLDVDFYLITQAMSHREFPRTNLASRLDETVDKGIDWLSSVGGKDFNGIKIRGQRGIHLSNQSTILLFSFISSFGQTLPRSLSIWITLHVAHCGNSRWNKPLLILLVTAVRGNWDLWRSRHQARGD